MLHVLAGLLAMLCFSVWRRRLGGNPKGMDMVAYNTSKGAVINFTRTLGCEWGKHGINVNAVLPGFFPTKMTRATIKMKGEVSR